MVSFTKLFPSFLTGFVTGMKAKHDNSGRSPLKHVFNYRHQPIELNMGNIKRYPFAKEFSFHENPVFLVGFFGEMEFVLAEDVLDMVKQWNLTVDSFDFELEQLQYKLCKFLLRFSCEKQSKLADFFF